MIKIGNTGIVGVYKGSTPITSIYKGVDLVFGGSTPPLDSDIVFEYDTALGGNNTVYLPIVPLHLPDGNTGGARFTVDWGDGLINNNIYISTYIILLVSHTYDTAGTYEVRVNMTGETNTFMISDTPIIGDMPYNGLYGLTKIKSYGDTTTTLYFSIKSGLPNLTYLVPDYYGILTPNNPNTQEHFNITISSGAETLNIDNFAPKLSGNSPKVTGNMTTLGSLFGHNDKITNFNLAVLNCTNLESIEEMYCAGATSMVGIFNGSLKLHTIKSMYWGKINNSSNVFLTSNIIRHLTIKNIGENLSEDLSADQYNFSKLQYWGVNNEDCPNARQSLIDSLLTYSKDLGSECSIPISLSQNTYNLLTPTEIQLIEAKGYRLSAS